MKLKGFVEQINKTEEEEIAVILLENRKRYCVPLAMLPRNVEVDDFVIIENGHVVLDPKTDDLKDELHAILMNMIENPK